MLIPVSSRPSREPLNLNLVREKSLPAPIRRILSPQSLIAYYQSCQDIWNKYAETKDQVLKKAGFGFLFPRMSCEFEIDQLSKGYGQMTPHLTDSMLILERESSRQDSLGCSAGGLLHLEQIWTIIDTIVQGIIGKRVITIRGCMQAGKSGTIDGLFLWEGLCRYLMLGDLHKPFVLCPRRKTLVEQGHEELDNFWKLHQSISLHDPRSKRATNAQLYYKNELQLENLKNSAFDPKEYMSSSAIPTIEHYAGIRIRNARAGIRTILYVDEIHFGSKLQGVMDQIMGNDLRNGDESILVRCISATPYEFLRRENFDQVDMWIGNGYCGWPFFGGTPLKTSPGYVQVVPECGSYAEKFGVPEVSLDCYKDFDKFAKRTWTDNQHEEFPDYAQTRWKSFRSESIRSLVVIIEKGLLGHSRNGMMIRLPTENSIAEEMMKKVEQKINSNRDFDDRVEFIPFSGDNGKYIITNLLLAHNCGTGRKFVIYCTANARMGCVVPKVCSLFIDLTARFSTISALAQGLVGRAHGYGKKTAVYLSSESNLQLKDYIQTKGCNGDMRPHARADHHFEGKKRRGPKSLIRLMIPFASLLENGGKTIQDCCNRIVDLENNKNPELRSWTKGHTSPRSNEVNSRGVMSEIRKIQIALSDDQNLCKRVLSVLGFDLADVDLLAIPDDDERDQIVRMKMRALRGEKVDSPYLTYHEIDTPEQKQVFKSGIRQLNYGVIVARRNGLKKGKSIETSHSTSGMRNKMATAMRYSLAGIELASTNTVKSASGDRSQGEGLHYQPELLLARNNNWEIQILGLLLHLRTPARVQERGTGLFNPTEESIAFQMNEACAC